MSLEHIRAYLFGDVDIPAMKQAIVVDATLTPLKEKDVFVCACKMKIGSHSLAANQGTKAEDLWSILKKNQDSGQVLLPKKELLLKQYQHLIDSGYERIYSIHSSYLGKEALASPRAAKAALGANKERVILIDTCALPFAQSLFVRVLREAICEKQTKQEIDWLIKKQATLNFSFISAARMGPSLTKELAYQNKEMGSIRAQLEKQVFELRPLFSYSSQDKLLRYDSSFVTDKQAHVRLLEMIDEHILSQSRYAKRIAIEHNGRLADAKKVKKDILAIHSSAPIDIDEMSLASSALLGPEALTVSFI